MSKFKTISFLRGELNKINSEIDECILRGKSYDRLAERHKAIVGKMDRLYRDMSFTRALRFLSLL
jgi:hypothetical protein